MYPEWWMAFLVVLIVMDSKTCGSGSPWLKIFHESQSQTLCLLSEDYSDRMWFDVKAVVQNDTMAGFLYHNVNDLFDNCEMAEKSVIVLHDLPKENTLAAISRASQDQLRLNIWIVAVSENGSTANGYFSEFSKRLSLRVLIFFLHLQTLELVQIHGTATKHQVLTVYSYK